MEKKAGLNLEQHTTQDSSRCLHRLTLTLTFSNNIRVSKRLKKSRSYLLGNLYNPQQGTDTVSHILRATKPAQLDIYRVVIVWYAYIRNSRQKCEWNRRTGYTTENWCIYATDAFFCIVYILHMICVQTAKNVCILHCNINMHTFYFLYAWYK